MTTDYWKSEEFAKRHKGAEHITGPFGLQLLLQCGLDRAEGSEDIVLLDNATGTGIVLEYLYGILPPAAKARLQVVAGDLSPAMISAVQERIEQNGWVHIDAKLVDAMDMDLPSNQFTHVTANFGLVGIPDPRAVLSEVYRVLRPSGSAAFSIFKTVAWYDIAKAAITSIPGAPRFPTLEEYGVKMMKDPQPGDEQWTRPEFFEEQIRNAGFEDVQTTVHENRTRYKDTEEYVKVYKVDMMLKNSWSKEDWEGVEPHIQSALVEELKRRFGDGEIVLNWEAYCVTAKVPPAKP
ncbi:S-adenosyl-L-methionine-dependent methyltransferase [Dichomitus squalens]|nr:S-adenosyl-L-methionine-dependent methyltransferase [Dichomitus squalens]